jgi:hypothetical protein
MKIEWPLAIDLALVFVVMSYVRWRWFKARMRRIPPPHREPPPG